MTTTTTSRVVDIDGALYALSIDEDGVPPRWRVEALDGAQPDAASIELRRPDGRRETYALVARDGALRSAATIPEPHEFVAALRVGAGVAEAAFVEPDHGHAHDSVHRDNNLRAAMVHVMADAAVSILVIVGLTLARGFGWLWMDPLAGLVGAGVIVSWSIGLIRDAGAVLLDMNPDARLTAALARGDRTRRRRAGRSASVAARPRPSRRDPVDRSGERPRRRRLSPRRDAGEALLAPDDRGRAQGRTAARRRRRSVA